jgi:thioredoxin-like negative regulator of GroEL
MISLPGLLGAAMFVLPAGAQETPEKAKPEAAEAKAGPESEAKPGPKPEPVAEKPAVPWTEADSRLANQYLQLLQREPSYGKVLDLLWDLYEKKAQTPLLLDYLKGASESGPEVAKLIYAHLLRKSGDVDAARPFYDQVLEADPANLPAMKALAEIADQQKRWAKALSLYTRLVELVPATDPDGLAMRLRKAAIHRLQGQTEMAVADWKALLVAQPGNVPLRSEIVGLLLEAGETDAAVAVLTELAKAEDPRRRLDALLELNRLHEYTGDFDGAVTTAREAMAVLHFKSPEYAELFSRVVRMHERHDRLGELESTLAKAAGGENPAERALHDLAEYYRLTADPVKEEEAVARLAEKLPGDPDHRTRLAELQLRNDRYEPAAATLDALLATGGTPPVDLVLRRTLVDLQAKGREAAAARLTSVLDSGAIDLEGRREILDFARTHYLDGLVERLLRDPALLSGDSPDENAAPIELARFLHERGRTDQAIATLREFIAAAGGATLEKSARFHRAGVVLKDLGLEKEALEAIDEAIALAPGNLEYQSSRADLYVATQSIDQAIAQLEAIRAGREGLEERAEVDQRLFSLIRGHYATKAEAADMDPSVLKNGSIQTLAEYRKLAAAANQAATRSGDEPPPKELIDYYDSIKQAANETPGTATRYRAAWWALKLLDNQECYSQLNLANEESGKPVVEVEKMLLLLAEQNERPTLMVRHLTTLIEIDPENADDYRQRRAATRFELGFEDEAVRELKELAAKPDAPLATLNTLAKLYQRQGSPGKQVEVWQQAYRDADLFEKRSIIKQLSTALIESGQPEEALKAQLDLLERETDPVQRRKQLDGQLTAAQSHFLLEWMLDRYAELASRHPFDRFYPEALARVHHAAGNDREAYEAMKKAYYMSGRNEELLAELGALSDRLGDLKSAIYYRRQLLARGEGDTLENWKELVRMLEKDLRVSEADQLRRRLETKFGSDTDFLAELTDHYLKTGSPRDAERSLTRLVALRGWDLEARFRLGLIQAAREEDEAAFATFNAILKDTGGVAYPGNFGRDILPLIRVARGSAMARGSAEDAMETYVFTVEGYPFIGGNLQDEIADALQVPRPEFTPAPKEEHLLRMRSLEEASALAAKLGRVPAWLAEWNVESRPAFERLWATRHAGAGTAFADLLKQHPARDSHTDQLFLAYCHLLAGDKKRFLDWVAEENPASGTQHPRSIYAAMAALILLKDNSTDPLCRPAMIIESLADLGVPKTVAAHHFSELRKAGRYAEAYRLGCRFADTVMADETSFQFALSQVAGLAGLAAERERWLDRSLKPLAAGTGTRVSNHFYTALTEKLALLDSDTERADYLKSLATRTEIAPTGEGQALERTLFIALASQDTRAVSEVLKRIVAREVGTTRPATTDPRDAGHEQGQTWQRLDRIFHHHADRVRLDAATVKDFVGAFAVEPILNPADASVSAQYEQFEIDRNLLLLEWMNAPERSAFLRELRGLLREPDSRIELAKALESRGFHREAVPVYHDDALRRDRDYAPLQGLFDAAAEALDPGPALDVIAKINTREFPAPPGLTVDYLNEQHARFLLIDGDLERLTQLGRAPVVGQGAPPVTSRAHLPYQDALVEGYRRTGRDDQLLRLLGDLRKRGEASVAQLLLGGETLANASRHAEAIEWLKPIALDPSEPVPQRRALRLSIDSHRATGWKDPGAVRELALASFERQPAGLTRTLAAALHEAGAAEDASGILRLLRRGTSDAVQRTATSMELLRLERIRGRPWTELETELENVFLDFAYHLDNGSEADESRDPELPRPNAAEFVASLVSDAAAAAAMPDLLGRIHAPAPNRWLHDLLAAHYRNRLAPVARALLSDLDPAAPDALRVLETLPAFGPEGVALARALVEESALPGDAFFPNEPERQVAFFHRIADRNRLIEVHGRLVRETHSDFFHQAGMEEWVPTLERRGRLPLLFAAIGERELARSLFAACDAALASYQWNHLAFLNDEAAFLIGIGAHAEAEALLKRILNKSLRIDLRLLPRLYAAWGKTAEWEPRTRDLHLTQGQEVMIRDWMTALAEGRELREDRDSW